MLASAVAVISACLHRELNPYRRASVRVSSNIVRKVHQRFLFHLAPRHLFSALSDAQDNATAVLAQWLIYTWVVVLLARLMHTGLGSTPVLLIGLALLAVSLAVVGHALVAAKHDLDSERRAAEEDAEGDGHDDIEMAQREQSMGSDADEPTVQSANNSGQQEPGGIADVAVVRAATSANNPPAVSWSTLSAGSICVAQADDGEQVPSESAGFPICI